MKFRWLHISDIHYHYSAYNSIRLREEFLKKIRVSNQNSSIDYIFITGDLSDKNGKINNDLLEYLNLICQATCVVKTNVFIVPGNHDHDRNSTKSVLDNVYRYYDNPEKSINTYAKTNEIIDNLDTSSTETLIESFSDYEKLCSLFYGDEKYSCKNHVKYFKPENLTVSCINTCMYDRSSDDEKCELHIGIKDLHSTLKKFCLSDENINIAIGHHPSTVLNKEEKINFLDCLRANNIHLYLCGHKHKPDFVYHSNEDIHEIITSYGNSDCYASGGFSIGMFDTEQNQYYIDFFKWKKGDKWVIDTEVENCAEGGRCYLNGKKYRHINVKNIVVPIKMYGPKLLDKSIINLVGDNFERLDYPYDEIDVDNIDWAEQVNIAKEFANSLYNITGKNIHLFPLAPIPILITIGYFLQNNCKYYIYQYDRNKNLWVDNSLSPTPKYEIEWVRKHRLIKSKKLIIKISTSSEIQHRQIDISLKDDVLELSLVKKTLGQPLYSNHYREMLNALFSQINSIVSRYKEIHIYAAVPAGMALEIGRQIQKGVYPEVHLYNYKNGYIETNTIND